MAAKRSTTPAAPTIEDVEDLLDVAGDATHKVWFYRKRDGDWKYLGSVAPPALRGPGIREYARTRWGGGDFRAKLRGVDGKWSYSRTFTIEGEATIAAHDDKAVTGDRERRRRRPRYELHPLVEQLVVPIALTIGAALTKKMLEDPKTDPLVLELLRRNSRGESIDPLTLQRSLLEAEARGEQRGRELGTLHAQLEAGDGEASTSGVVTAVRESAAAVQSVIDYARGGASTSPPTRVLPAPPASSTAVATVSPVAPASADSTVPNIVPEYLKPAIARKADLLMAADFFPSAKPIAGIVIENATDEQWAALIDADAVGRLESDFYAAVPELATTDRRKAFVTDLLSEIRAGIAEAKKAPPKEAANG